MELNQPLRGKVPKESNMRQIDKTLTKRLGGSSYAIDEEARTATFVFSSSSADRMGDIIDQKTWQLDRYRKNPQFLFGHKSRDLPIGRTVELDIKGGKLVGTVKFATAEEYPFADTCWKLVKGGFLNAVSVGFIPHKYESYEDNGQFGYKFYDCELLECSLVPIPANQDALLGKDFSGALEPVYRGLLTDFSDSDADVFDRDALEAVVKSFGDSGTKDEPNMNFADDIEGRVVYDQSGEMMGLMVGGALKIARTYQDKLRARNAVLIDQQAEAAQPTSVTTEEKKAPVVAPNFFLKRAAVRRLARNTLLGT
jgi:HK97 family phage prohead protease